MFKLGAQKNQTSHGQSCVYVLSYGVVWVYKHNAPSTISIPQQYLTTKSDMFLKCME